MMKITEVKIKERYQLWLRFHDGIEGIVDLSDLVGQGVFKAWKDQTFFNSVKIDRAGALSWGNINDLCADALYLDLTGQNPEKIFPKLKTTQANA